LNYLEKCTRPDIAFATHQCARFSADPRKPHADAVKWLGCYHKTTWDKGLILRPTGSSFNVYVDADFAGNWHRDDAEHSYTAWSRHGYIIMYTGCPLHWASQLQTKIALSTTKSKFIGLSMALCMTIPIMEMIKELHRLGFWFGSTKPTIHCQVFQDNSSVIEMATVPKICPQTKHINVKYHHFWDYVDQGKILSMPLTAKINQLTCSPCQIHMRHSASTSLQDHGLGWKIGHWEGV